MPNWREQWYAERGLPYEKPKLDIFSPPWQCVGSIEKVEVPKNDKVRAQAPWENFLDENK